MRESGYLFKKGYSRSKSCASSSENSSDEGNKRAKVDKDERQREISHLESLLSKIEEHLKIKQSRIEKAKLVKDFKLCDELSNSIRVLMREKRENEKLLAAFQKKESKSTWYGKRKQTKKADSAPQKKVKEASDVASLFKQCIPKQGNESTLTSSAGQPPKSSTGGIINLDVGLHTRADHVSSEATLIPAEKVSCESYSSESTMLIQTPYTNVDNPGNDTVVRPDQVDLESNSSGDTLIISPESPPSSPLTSSQAF